MSRWRFRRPTTPPGGANDWRDAKPRSIARALERAVAQSGGGWLVLDASRRIGKKPVRYDVAGQSLVAWRDGEVLRVAPDECPHLGASLATGRVCDGKVICPWHGLALGDEGFGTWKPFASYDDGVLAWVQLAADEAFTDRPILPPRPSVHLAGVVRLEVRCEPADVLANRLDPWHGAHFHPYSFGQLEVLEESDERLVVRVEKKIAGSVRVEVDASFHCPDPRTIVMTILDGEGAGSLVETHATPLGPGRTAVVEATLATSPRPGFAVVARHLTPLVRPLIERSARRLWVDDAAYAERTYELRQRGWTAWGLESDDVPHATRTTPGATANPPPPDEPAEPLHR